MSKYKLLNSIQQSVHTSLTSHTVGTSLFHLFQDVCIACREGAVWGTGQQGRVLGTIPAHKPVNYAEVILHAGRQWLSRRQMHKGLANASGMAPKCGVCRCQVLQGVLCVQVQHSRNGPTWTLTRRKLSRRQCRGCLIRTTFRRWRWRPPSKPQPVTQMSPFRSLSFQTRPRLNKTTFKGFPFK